MLGSKNKKPFKEFMSEKHEIDRWGVVRIALFGAFCGVCGATIYYLSAIIP